MKQALLIVLGSALVTAATIKAAPALSQEVNVARVETGDLDLSSEGGRRALDQRLFSAARQVCGEASDADLEGKNDARRCRDEVLARVQAERAGLLASADRRAITLIASR